MQTCSKSKIWPKINNAKENGHFENKSVPQNALLLIAGFDLFFLGTADVLPQRAGRFCFFLIFFSSLAQRFYLAPTVESISVMLSAEHSTKLPCAHPVCFLLEQRQNEIGGKESDLVFLSQWNFPTVWWARYALSINHS